MMDAKKVDIFFLHPLVDNLETPEKVDSFSTSESESVEVFLFPNRKKISRITETFRIGGKRYI
jgi:hypothetical protein